MHQPAPAEKPSDFPAPMNFSFGTPSEAPGASKAGKPILSLGLQHSGPNDPSPYSMETDADVGPDWRNMLSAWVEARSYYPEQAAMLSQQGTVRVLVTMMPTGKVLEVETERRSGSPWLDLALDGLFRGATLPAMPASVGEKPVSFHFTMHYILLGAPPTMPVGAPGRIR
jgi:TonB family protein